jgi:hypothetical protein
LQICASNRFRRNCSKSLIRALAKEPRDRYQQIKTMRDELRAVLQDISGMPILQGDAYAPRHFENNVMKRAGIGFQVNPIRKTLPGAPRRRLPIRRLSRRKTH